MLDEVALFREGSLDRHLRKLANISKFDSDSFTQAEIEKTL